MQLEAIQDVDLLPGETPATDTTRSIIAALYPKIQSVAAIGPHAPCSGQRFKRSAFTYSPGPTLSGRLADQTIKRGSLRRARVSQP
ncbi:hypothetical protein [Sphingomonas sp. CARO-RG-8B-R24-01]|uniref:hypothetical protein n=1 Tax=Sphingomonas sp. CARO-RG-8B-R24-01 TaxID=2914831 RepID=UPI001F59AD9F|nr:hypothetical protein [Sphingomonas sp. CARO-RG-8B-R24-01]